MNKFCINSIPLLNKFSLNWRSLIRHPLSSIYITKKYTKNLVYQDKNNSVYIIEWLPKAESVIHNHIGPGCCFKLLKGSLKEIVYKNDIEKINYLKYKQYRFINNKLGKHKIINLLDKNSFSIHIYPNKYF